MLKIRLQRTGRKHEPTFRLVVTDSKNSTKSGKSLETIGSHDFRRKGSTIINADRAKHWLAQGAQASGTVHNLLITNNVITGKKINVLPKKTVEKKEEPVVEVKAQPKAAPVVAPAPVAAPVVEAVVEVAPVSEPEPVVEAAPVEEAPVAPVEVSSETPSEVTAEAATEVAPDTNPEVVA